MSKVIDSTIEYALEYLGTVAKQVDGMRIPDRTWTYMLSRMDTLDTLQSIVQDSMSQHAAWINQSLMMINEEPLDIVGWQMLIQDISSETGVHPSILAGLEIAVNADRAKPLVTIKGPMSMAYGDGISTEAVMVVMQMAKQGMIDQDKAIELAKKSEVPIYDHEKQVELMAKQMGLDVSELDGIEPPYSGDDVFML